MHGNRNTFMAKREDADVEWFLFDAEGKTLGRLASEIAKVLRGKHKATFTPHADTGDGVIIVNAEKVKVTGNKEGQKVYRRYSGYPGGQKVIPYRMMLDRKPTFILEHAIKGMMPKKSSLARSQLKRLRIFKGAEHTMNAQRPTKVEI